MVIVKAETANGIGKKQKFHTKNDSNESNSKSEDEPTYVSVDDNDSSDYDDDGA